MKDIYGAFDELNSLKEDIEKEVEYYSDCVYLGMSDEDYGSNQSSLYAYENVLENINSRLKFLNDLYTLSFIFFLHYQFFFLIF